MDQRGILGLSLPVLILLAILGIFGFSIIGAINWKFLMAIMMFLVIGLTLIGVVFMKMDFKYVIIVSMICLAITFVITVTPAVIMGFLVVGFAMWKLSPQKHLALMIALIGIGLILVLWGSMKLAELGIFP